MNIKEIEFTVDPKFRLDIFEKMLTTAGWVRDVVEIEKWVPPEIALQRLISAYKVPWSTIRATGGKVPFYAALALQAEIDRAHVDFVNSQLATPAAGNA